MGDESIGETIAGIVEGTIVGTFRAFSESRQRSSDRILERSGIIVERITNHASKWLDQALVLLEEEKRITADELDAHDDMVRFARESNESRWYRYLRFRDHFFVARTDERVEAMAFFTHYPRDRQSLLSYFVARRDSARASKRSPLSLATVALAQGLAAFHASRRPRPRWIVAEVDDPRLTASPPQRNQRRGRIELFGQLANIQGTSLRVLDFPYVQPSVDPHDAHAQRQMLLVLVPLPGQPAPAALTKAQAGALIRWLYERVYGDSFETNPELDPVYRAYVRRLLEEQRAGMPDTIPCPDAKSWLTATKASPAAV